MIQKQRSDQPTRAIEASVPVEKLHLDCENPRLPEHLLGATERKVLEYLHEEGNLIELAQSLVDNGFFSHEPLIVYRREDSDFDVFEGNRRLATLLILLKLPIAAKMDLDVEPTRSQLDRLRMVPVREVANRAEVSPFVGFRHIGGMKKWAAEAKARYVFAEVEVLARSRDPDPFKALGRRVGSNARAMRASYASIALLRRARDEGDFDYRALIDERRFGVWLRAYDAARIRGFIGFGDPTTYQEVKRAIRGVNVPRLVEVLGDFVAQDGLPPIMDDSRDMTLYANILSDPKAHKTLRRTRSLEVAAVLVIDESLVAKLGKLTRQIEALQDRALQTRMGEDVRTAADGLHDAARALRAIVHRSDDDA